MKIKSALNALCALRLSRRVLSFIPCIKSEGLVLVLASILLALLYYFVNPEGVSWLPKCGLYQYTGLKCPICGAQRAAHHILHGNFLVGLHYNYFIVVTVVYWLIVLIATRKNLTKYFYFYCLLALIWAIIRNFLSL